MKLQKIYTTALALAFAVLSGNAMAVYYQPVTVTSSDGEPVQSATISISIAGQDTIEAKDNGKNDSDKRAGYFKIALPDDAKGKNATLVIKSDGKTTRRTIKIGSAATVAISSGSTIVPAALTGGQWAVNISSTFGGNTDTRVVYSGSPNDGQEINRGQVGIGLDYRLPMPNMANMFWGGSFDIFTGTNEGLNQDLHPTPRPADTFIELNERLAFMLYAGMVVASFQDAFDLAVLGGARITQSEIYARTNEAGNEPTFRDKETHINPSVSLELTGPECDTLGGRWRAGLALERSSAHSVSGQGVGGYHFSTDADWSARAYGGLLF